MTAVDLVRRQKPPCPVIFRESLLANGKLRSPGERGDKGQRQRSFSRMTPLARRNNSQGSSTLGSHEKVCSGHPEPHGNVIGTYLDAVPSGRCRDRKPKSRMLSTETPIQTPIQTRARPRTSRAGDSMPAIS